MEASPAIVGAGLLFFSGFVLRAVAVRDDARRLKLPEEVRQEDGLRGAYVATRFGAALMAAGLAGGLNAAWGTSGVIGALLLAPGFLLMSDLLPRALSWEATPAPEGAAWTSLLGRSLGPIESALTPGTGPTWTHGGLSPLVRVAPDDETWTERLIARRVFDFGDAAVADVMVPLVDVIAVRDDSPLEEVIRIATRERFSRLPVFHERLPNIVGVLHVFDLLLPQVHSSACDRMRPPAYVPEKTPASDLLRRLQAEGINLAVVVDEYGGATGIVTIEDILEEVVGEIEDEYDEDQDPVRVLGPDAWLVEGRAEIERLNERFPWKLPEGDYETIAGLLLKRRARVPTVGENLTLENVVLQVTQASPRSVDQIRVKSRAIPSSEENR